MTMDNKDGDCGCGGHKSQDTAGAAKNKPVKNNPVADKNSPPEAGLPREGR